MQLVRGWVLRVFGAAVLLATSIAAFSDVELPTNFSNHSTIVNTRHNMTQRQRDNHPGATADPNLLLSGGNMDPYRNDYAEICVYCHTPHGANAGVALPLWNRTIKATTYTTYAALGTTSLTQPVVQPGPNSLACLSCHDGQVGVDSVINMPGAGGYLSGQSATQSNAFLNAWTNPRGTDATVHVGLNPVIGDGCLACHSAGAGVVGSGASDFSIAVIGTDLRNDHPVGVRYPTVAAGVDFKPTTGTRTGLRWFDTDGDSRPDKGELRIFQAADGFTVECASCHDPHGVPSGGAGSTFNPTFLRMSNEASALCLTCHTK